MVFADFAVFSILSDILISGFTFGLAHENKTFKGKSYEQLLSKKFFREVPRFLDFELRSVIFDYFECAK